MNHLQSQYFWKYREIIEPHRKKFPIEQNLIALKKKDFVVKIRDFMFCVSFAFHLAYFILELGNTSLDIRLTVQRGL